MGRTSKKRRAQEFHSGALLAFFCALVFLFGCSRNKIPEGKTAVEAVDIRGQPSAVEEDLAGGLATQKSPTLFGIPGIYEYETYDAEALQKDIERIERQLRRRGYYEARVTAARVFRTKENRVRVEINIHAGKPIKIRELATSGLAKLPFDVAQAAANEISLHVGDRFDEDQFETAKQDVANALANRGYAFARVTGKAEIDLAARSARIEIHAVPGEPAELGPIEIQGLHKIDKKPVERALKLHQGDVYSRAELRAARAALFELGVFSQVEILPDLTKPDSRVVPLTVRVTESTLRDVTVGLGARLDLLRLAAVAQTRWTHRNFFGGLREFSVSTRPGLTFFPTSVQYREPPTAIFPENALTVRLEQPGLIEGRTRGYTQVGYNIYPLLYPRDPEADPRSETVIGYNEFTTAVGAERTFFGRLFSTDLSLNWQANYPFTYQGLLVDGLEHVIVAYPEFKASVDLRDDPIQPTRGFLFTNSVQTALPVLGGSVVDVRIHPEVTTFVPLDQKHKVVLATRFGMGMVFPQGYGEALILADDALDTDYTDPNVVRDQHRLLFRAFYSGGPSSNRGYPYQRIGPQGTIGFLIPSNVACDGVPLNQRPPACIRPLGGFSMWEASAEIRYRAFTNWSFVAFVDASDVDGRVASFSLAEPHVSVGPGLRYLSPVGPIRVDLGYRVPGLQHIRNNSGEAPDVAQVSPYNRESQQTYGGVALHVLIGEAF